MVYIETYYLIDFENVHSDGLSGCKELGETDHIVIFFTQNAKNISMTEISNHGAAQLEMIEVPAGKQSTDMHIGSYLGYLVGKTGKSCKVVIVSKDTDFDNVIKFWGEKTGIMCLRTQKISKSQIKVSGGNKQQTITKQVSGEYSEGKKTKFRQEVMQAVRNAGFDASVANTVAQITINYFGDEHMLSKVHNELMVRYCDYQDVYDSVKKTVSKYANEMPIKNDVKSITPKGKTALNTEIQRILSKAGFSNDIVSYVASTAVKNLGMKSGKQQSYRAIISKYGQNKGSNIYNHIKKYI